MDNLQNLIGVAPAGLEWLFYFFKFIIAYVGIEFMIWFIKAVFHKFIK